MSTKVPIEITAELSGIRKELEGLKGYMEGWGTAIKTSLSNLAFDTIRSGISSVASTLRETITEATEAARANTKLEAVLKATGNAAGWSAQQMKGLAGDLMNVVDIDDDVIVNAEAIIATFRQIKGENFKEATKAALDMSAVLGTDLQGAALQVGKALNSPTEGLTALRRAGVSFTEDQKEMIKSLEESGDLIGAQQVVLEELKNEFGGAAEAMANAAGHGLGRFSLMIANVKEDLGGKLLPVLDKFLDTLGTKLKPVLDEIVEKFGQWDLKDGSIDTFADAIVNLTKEFGSLADSLKTTVLPLFSVLLQSIEDLVSQLPNTGRASASDTKFVNNLSPQQFAEYNKALAKAERAWTFAGSQSILAEAGVDGITNQDNYASFRTAMQARTNRMARDQQVQHQAMGWSDGSGMGPLGWASLMGNNPGSMQGFTESHPMVGGPAGGSMFGGLGGFSAMLGMQAALSANAQMLSPFASAGVSEGMIRQAFREDQEARKGKKDKGFSADIESAEQMVSRMAAAAASREPKQDKIIVLNERIVKLAEEKKAEDAAVATYIKKSAENTGKAQVAKMGP